MEIERPVIQKAQSHNSSRVVVKIHETPIPFSKKIQQFREDPDVLEYLQKNFAQGQGRHAKSNFPINYMGNKVHTEISVQQQKSTEHSMSRGKNKSAKNLKSKKTKFRAGLWRVLSWLTDRALFILMLFRLRISIIGWIGRSRISLYCIVIVIEDYRMAKNMEEGRGFGSCRVRRTAQTRIAKSSQMPTDFFPDTWNSPKIAPKTRCKD